MQTTAVEQPGQEKHTGPILIAFNGTPASEHALSAAAQLLTERRALVLVVWKSGLGFELLEIPSVTGLPPAPDRHPDGARHRSGSVRSSIWAARRPGSRPSRWTAAGQEHRERLRVIADELDRIWEKFRERAERLGRDRGSASKGA